MARAIVSRRSWSLFRTGDETRRESPAGGGLAALGEELVAGLARMREDVDTMGRSLTAHERTTTELRQDVTRLGERVDRLELRIDGIEARLDRIELRLDMEAR